MHSMHLYGDSNLHTKKKENSSNVTQIYLTFHLWTKGTKIINLSPSVLVKLALTDKNKKCKKNTRVAWKIDWYKIIFHFYVVFYFFFSGSRTDIYAPIKWGRKLAFSTQENK